MGRIADVFVVGVTFESSRVGSIEGQFAAVVEIERAGFGVFRGQESYWRQTLVPVSKT